MPQTVSLPSPGAKTPKRPPAFIPDTLILSVVIVRFAVLISKSEARIAHPNKPPLACVASIFFAGVIEAPSPNVSDTLSARPTKPPDIAPVTVRALTSIDLLTTTGVAFPPSPPPSLPTTAPADALSLPVILLIFPGGAVISASIVRPVPSATRPTSMPALPFFWSGLALPEASTVTVFTPDILSPPIVSVPPSTVPATMPILLVEEAMFTDVIVLSWSVTLAVRLP